MEPSQPITPAAVGVYVRTPATTPGTSHIEVEFIYNTNSCSHHLQPHEARHLAEQMMASASLADGEPNPLREREVLAAKVAAAERLLAALPLHAATMLNTALQNAEQAARQ